MQYSEYTNLLEMNQIAFEQKEQLVTICKDRFSTYGYKQIRTPSFELYDLYSMVKGTIEQDDMIKVIDPSGKVLVLRPDITIPITRMLAENASNLQKELRYFYILDVFRHSFGETDNQQRTQAGAEFFGNSSPEADAEILQLAIHLLKDVQNRNFILEIGHAGLIQELLELTPLQTEQINIIKQFIRTKNMNGLLTFLNELDMDAEVKRSLKNIPQLYGEYKEVIKKAREISLTDKMNAAIENLESICRLLEACGLDQYIVIDLGLINHMNYYSDIVFQGSIEGVGKPVLTGGRYNRLANQFHTTLPAIGFAFDIDLIVENIIERKVLELNDITIFYDENSNAQALILASELRELGYSATISKEINLHRANTSSRYVIQLQNGKKALINRNETIAFTDVLHLDQLLKKVRENQ